MLEVVHNLYFVLVWHITATQLQTFSLHGPRLVLKRFRLIALRVVPSQSKVSCILSYLFSLSGVIKDHSYE
jgi:hypothetical protein